MEICPGQVFHSFPSVLQVQACGMAEMGLIPPLGGVKKARCARCFNYVWTQIVIG